MKVNNQIYSLIILFSVIVYCSAACVPAIDNCKNTNFNIKFIYLIGVECD